MRFGGRESVTESDVFPEALSYHAKDEAREVRGGQEQDAKSRE